MKPVWFLLSAAVAAVVIAVVVIRFFNTMPERSTVDSLIFSLYVVGGALLALAPFDRKHQRSRWARGVLALSAALLMFVGVAELLRHYSVWVLSPAHEHAFSDTLEGLRGIIIGLFIPLLFSGELAGRRVSQRDQA
jgi:peptidoglycan/LPS O-acetylase OafA/YrhL